MQKKTLIAICSIGLLVGVIGFTSQGIAKDQAPQGEYGVLIPEEAKELNKKVGRYVTKYGEFVRADKAPTVEENQIARKKDDINADTKVLVFDYGIFVKQ